MVTVVIDFVLISSVLYLNQPRHIHVFTGVYILIFNLWHLCVFMIVCMYDITYRTPYLGAVFGLEH